MRIASSDEPAVLCLQEVPAWALPKLSGWAGMTAFPVLAARPRLGPIPSTARLGRALTSLHAGLLRSAFSGQGNAILLDPAFEAEDYHAFVLNSRSLRRREAGRLGLGAVARLAWSKERRVCQAIRAVLADGRRLLVANLHATGYPPDSRLADAELAYAARLVQDLTRPGEVEVLSGDFNLTAEGSETLRLLRDQGFSEPGPAVDHVVVRGAAASPPERWPEERRRVEGLLLSDHAPLEVTVE